MFAWIFRMKFKSSVAKMFYRDFEEKLAPMLETQEGFKQQIALIAPERNEAIAITLWDSKESADHFNHIAYLDVLRLLSKLVEGAPVVETFEIVDFFPSSRSIARAMPA